MAAQKGRKISPTIVAKSREVLEFARQRAASAKDSIEFSNAIFGLGGKATKLFETESERRAFSRTEQYKQVVALMDKLPQPPVKGFVEIVASANDAQPSRRPEKKNRP